MIAKAGRDLGKCFIVLSVENQFLYLCDGKSRKVDTPKKKKIKHAEFAGTAADYIRTRLQEGGITNKDIRRAVSEFVRGVTAEKH